MKLTVLLLKSSVDVFDDALRDGHGLDEVSLKKEIGDESALFVRQPHSNPPKWAAFLQPATVGTLTLANASSAAVLFVRKGDRRLAYTFGHGRNALNPESIEPRFGLKVALNTMDANRLRSADTRMLGDDVRTKRVQTSGLVDQTAFEFDTSRDLLRQISGVPSSDSLAKKVIGSDSLTLHANVTASGLGEKSQQLIDAFASNKYRDQFEWIDHLAPVTDPSRRAELDKRLVEALSKGSLDRMHLAATSVVDWDEVEDFKIDGTRGTVFPDLDLDAYVAAHSDIAAVSLERLKSQKVKVRFSGNDNYTPRGSVYLSLVWETKVGNTVYALVDGSWYAVDADYAEKVRRSVGAVPNPRADHLPETTTSESEGDYNERAANESSQLFLLDKKLVKPAGAATRIEFCDLFSKDKQLIHVKRKTSSATLSHLFAQGTVAAELFLQDPEVRKQVRETIRLEAPRSGFLQHVPEARPTASDYEVVYAIAAKPNANWPLSLPFFSQINLMASCQRLAAMGFSYALTLVEANDS